MLIAYGCGYNTKKDAKAKATTETKREEIKQDSEDVICLNAHRPINVLKPLVVKGDIAAYSELHVAFLDIDDSAFLPYALIMANKYDYDLAYYDVYRCLTTIYYDYDVSVSLSRLDVQTRNMALDYLKKGAEKGEHNSLLRLSRHYQDGIYVEKDTVLARQLLEKRKEVMEGMNKNHKDKNSWLIYMK